MSDASTGFSCARFASAQFASARFSSARFKFCIRALSAGALAVAVCFSLGASNAGSRLNDLSHRLMCTCGCAEILGECNHAGCTSSTTELNELRAGIEAGKSDDQILASFVTEYGTVVLAAPPTHGFDLVAWIAPFAVFAAGLLGTILLIRRWTADGMRVDAAASGHASDKASERVSGRASERAAEAATAATTNALREKIRRETGSDDDGGF